MKILHTADLHIGRQFNGLGLDADHQAVLDQIVVAVLAHKPNVLIIAGDIFDRASPPATAVRQFNQFVTRIAQETTTALVMIAGNHDSGDRIGAMAVMTDVRRALIRGPLHANEIPLVINDEHGPVAFSALPFAYEYAARECYLDESIGQPEHVVRAQIASARRHLPDGARWVIVSHAFVAGAQTSEGERPLARVGGIETVPPDVFDGAHYVALGHIHRPQTAGADHIRYSGSPLAFGFDEAGHEKSMCLVDLDAYRAVAITMIPFVPLRSARVLRGHLDDLLAGTPSNDIIKVILADEVPRIDPMKRLREIYPHACQLTYARDERPIHATLPEPIDLKAAQPMDVIGDFLQQVRRARLSAAELPLISSVLHEFEQKEAAT
ncbi:exonuclease SbcCD subunit D C-terminal domain-containing protein [Mesorhizobium sp. M0909]|uniref:exonuclease SbcCD subunit D n=1 Tax=Mesorhizobium sp. M0909 TaxID=2957024 RepID=UPI00333B9CB5